MTTEAPPDPFAPPATAAANSESSVANEPSVLARLDGFQAQRVRPILPNWAGRHGEQLPGSVVVVHSGMQTKEQVVTVGTGAGPERGQRATYPRIALGIGCGPERQEGGQRGSDRASMVPPGHSYFSASPHSLTRTWRAVSDQPQGAPCSALDTQRCAPQPAAAKSQCSSASQWLTGLMLLLATFSLSLGLPIEPRRHVAVEPVSAPQELGSASRKLPSAEITTYPLTPSPTRVASFRRSALPLSEEAPCPRARIEVNGFHLSVSAEPWLQAELDGRLLGNTPIKRVALHPGHHRLVLVDRDLTIRALATIQGGLGSRDVR